MIIADTNVLIDYLAGKGEAAAVDNAISSGALQTTVISRYELISGARAGKQSASIAALLNAIPTLHLDEVAADLASEIRKLLDGSGNSIGMADCLIAGIVMSNAGTLLTRNRRHFERVPGLRLA